MCVTSPPYFGLRDYGTAKWEGGDAACDHRKVSDAVAAIATSTLGGGKKTTGHQQEGFKAHCGHCGAVRIDSQLGLEKTPDEYVAKMVAVFREVRRVLRDDGTLWLNLGDSYAGGKTGRDDANRKNGQGVRQKSTAKTGLYDNRQRDVPEGMKPKDLVGIPWSVAKALQADYYAGRIAKEIDRVWLAAMIDAEGTICGFTHVRKDDGTTRTGVHVAITNSSIALLDNAQRMLRFWQVRSTGPVN